MKTSFSQHFLLFHVQVSSSPEIQEVINNEVPKLSNDGKGRKKAKKRRKSSLGSGISLGFEQKVSLDIFKQDSIDYISQHNEKMMLCFRTLKVKYDSTNEV